MSSGEGNRAVRGPARPTNPLGIVGLCLALLGLPILAGLSALYFLESPWIRAAPPWQVIVCGLLSPLGLVISAWSVFRVPKGAATAGVVFGMLGTLYLAGAGTLLIADEMELFTPPAEREKRREERSIAAVQRATAIINEHIATHGTAPNTEQGSQLIAGFVDGWGRPIHYLNDGGKDVKEFLVISAGPDREFGNSDDITNKSLKKEKEDKSDADGNSLKDDPGP